MPIGMPGEGAQSAKPPNLGFGSGHDLMVCECKPHIRLCADSAEHAWDSLSALPLLMCMCARALSLSFSLSLSQINLKKKILLPVMY